MPKFGNVSIESGSGALEFDETIEQQGGTTTAGQTAGAGGVTPFRPPVNVPAVNRFVSFIVVSASPFVNYERVLVAGSGLSMVDNGPNNTLVLSVNDAALNVNSSLQIQKTGTGIGTRPILNFIPGDNTILDVVDNPGQNRVDIEVSAVAGAGGVQYVGLQGSSGITVAGSPITVSGTATISLQTTGVTPGTYNNLTVDALGRVTAGNQLPYITGVTVSSKPGSGQTLVAETSGNKDFTFRRIRGSGTVDVTVVGGNIVVSAPTPPTFSGVTSVAVSGGVGIAVAGSPITTTGTIDLSLSPTAVTPGTYNNVTVDQYGRVTGGSNATYIDSIDLTSTSILGEEVIAGVSGVNDIQHRPIVGGGIVEVSLDSGAVKVSAPAASVNVTTSSKGTGASITAGVSGTEMNFKSLVGSGAVEVSAGVNSITVSAAPNPTALSQLTNDAGYITNAALQVSAAGTGLDLIAAVSGSEITHRPLLQGGIVTLSVQPGGEILVSAPATSVNLSETGTGVALLSATGSNLIQATLVGGGIIDVNEVGGEIVISAAPTDVPESDIITGYGGDNWVWASAAGSAVTIGVEGSEVLTINSSGMSITGSTADSALIQFTTVTTGTSADAGAFAGVPETSTDFVINNGGVDAVVVDDSGNVTVTSLTVSGESAYTLPASAGNTGDVLLSDGAGGVYWGAVSAASTTAIEQTALGTGTAVIASISAGTDIRHRTVVGSGSIEVYVSGDEVVVSAPSVVAGETDIITGYGGDNWVWASAAGSAISIGVNGNEIITITPSGNIGIGTSTPTAKFEIFDSGAGSSFIQFSNPTTGTSADSGTVIGIPNGSPDFEITNYENSDFRINNAGVEALVIDNTGLTTVESLRVSAEGVYTLPVSGGTAGQVLTTGGDGTTAYWADPVDTTQVTEVALGTGESIIAAISGQTEIQHRTLVGAGIVEVRTSGDEVFVSASVSDIETDRITGYGGDNWVLASAAGSAVTVGVGGEEVLTITQSGMSFVASGASTSLIQFTTSLTGTSADAGAFIGLPDGSTDFVINNGGSDALSVSNTGEVKVEALTVSAESVYSFPVSGGTNGQVLTTDGSGGLYWAFVSAGAGSVTISDEGSNLGTATEIDFVGANVSATFSGGTATVNVGGVERYGFQINFNASSTIDSTTPTSNLPAGWSSTYINANDVQITHNVGKRPRVAFFHGFTAAGDYRAIGGNGTFLYMYWASATETTSFEIHIQSAAQALSEANGHVIVELIFD